MFAYFPRVYEDELLYSIIARLSLHIGSPASAALMCMLFGHAKANASLGLQSDLPRLAANIPPDRDLTVQRLIADHTLLPYFLAYASSGVKRRASKSIEHGDVQNLHILVGVTAFRVQPVSHLRFCRECCEEMSERLGEMYWRRTHQLPSALVCPIHGTMLLNSNVSLRNIGRHVFQSAHRLNCPNTAQPAAILCNSNSCRLLFQEIALQSAALLNDNVPVRSFAEWGQYYRGQLIERGFALSRGRIDQGKLEARFCEHFGSALAYFPGAQEGQKLRGDWLAGMVRLHRHAVHPQFHILLQHFCLGQEVLIPPFGNGPWPCLNPVARHRSEFPIMEFTQHTNHDHRVAVFRCQCGYAYTRNFDPVSGKIGPPRFLAFGRKFEHAMKKMLARSMSLRQIGVALRLDPKTVVRLAVSSNIDVPWKTGRRPQIEPERYRVVRYRAIKIRPLSNPSERRILLRDWRNIDGQWLERIKVLIAEMYREVPPVRVCLGAVERRANARGWLAKRQELLPLTSAYLNLASESVSAFQLRRVRSIISAAYRTRISLRPWEVMREAGLRSDSLPWISNELYAPSSKMPRKLT